MAHRTSRVSLRRLPLTAPRDLVLIRPPGRRTGGAARPASPRRRRRAASSVPSVQGSWLLGELSFQPCAGHSPVALDGALGYFEDQGNLGKGEATEEVEFDDPRLAGVEVRKAFEGLIEDEHVNSALLRRNKRVVQSDLTLQSSPLASPFCAGMVHEDVSHQLGSGG